MSAGAKGNPTISSVVTHLSPSCSRYCIDDTSQRRRCASTRRYAHRTDGQPCQCIHLRTHRPRPALTTVHVNAPGEESRPVQSFRRGNSQSPPCALRAARLATKFTPSRSTTAATTRTTSASSMARSDIWINGMEMRDLDCVLRVAISPRGVSPFGKWDIRQRRIEDDGGYRPILSLCDSAQGKETHPASRKVRGACSIRNSRSLSGARSPERSCFPDIASGT